MGSGNRTISGSYVEVIPASAPTYRSNVSVGKEFGIVCNGEIKVCGLSLEKANKLAAILNKPAIKLG